MNQEKIMQLLDALYAKALEGLPPHKESAIAMAERYIKKADSVDEAAMALINAQLRNCTATGFVMGLGGLITLPVAVPINLVAVLYFQMRMIAGLAYMGGYDIAGPQLRLMSYVCLAGISLEQVLKGTGIKIGTRITKSVVSKLPGKLSAAINRRLGYSLFTKFGNRSAVSLGKAVPIIGGIVSGSLDFVETRLIAERAYNMFIRGDVSNTAGFAEYEILYEEDEA